MIGYPTDFRHTAHIGSGDFGGRAGVTSLDLTAVRERIALASAAVSRTPSVSADEDVAAVSNVDVDDDERGK
jgi:hypothetical protein